MPFDYFIDTKRGIVFARAWGKVTDEDVFEQQRNVREDPEFDPTFRGLIDFSQVEQFAMSADGLRAAAAGDYWGPESRRAHVSPTDVTFGMVRMYEGLVSDKPQEVAVFRTASEAREWLGIDDDDPGPNAD